MGGFRPVYSKGTVEYVDHSLRRQMAIQM